MESEYNNAAKDLGYEIARGVCAGIPEYMLWIPMSIHSGARYASNNPKFADSVEILNKLYAVWWTDVVRYYARAMIEFHSGEVVYGSKIQ